MQKAAAWRGWGHGGSVEARVQLWTPQLQPRALTRRAGWVLCGLLTGLSAGAADPERLRGPSRESQRTDGDRTGTKAPEGPGRVPRGRALC